MCDIKANEITQASLSGTSMAGPYVAGTAAYLLGFEGKYSPTSLTSRLTTLSSKNYVTGLTSITKNNLLYNGSGR